MGLLFKNELHDEFGGWALGYIAYGGPDFGEIAAIGAAVGEGDDGAFYEAWTAVGARFAEEGEARFAAGHRDSARELFLKASACYALSYHPLYGEPVDPRLLAAFRAQSELLRRGLALAEPAARWLEIPFEGTTLPACFLPAAGGDGETRPLLLLTNGYDGTLTDMYFAMAVAASRRGYHCLLFDGPGQGGALILQGLRLRPDWETVVRAVVDLAAALPGVDPARIALSGWSLGGYLALRAASGEPRLAACVADPGLMGMASGMKRFGITTASHLAEGLETKLDADRHMHWAVRQRGFWVHGVDNLSDYFREALRYSLAGRLEGIRCPTLLTMAEADQLAATAPEVYDGLACPKTLMRFTVAEGAGEHCEMRNRTLLNRRVLDWLDGWLKPAS